MKLIEFMIGKLAETIKMANVTKLGQLLSDGMISCDVLEKEILCGYGFKKKPKLINGLLLNTLPLTPTQLRSLPKSKEEKDGMIKYNKNYIKIRYTFLFCLSVKFYCTHSHIQNSCLIQ